MQPRMVLGGMLLMLIGMQLMAVGQLGMVGGLLIVAVVMGAMRLAVMLGGGFEMLGGLFVVIVLGHGKLPLQRLWGMPAAGRAEAE
jgi:hypothetical protein